MKTIIILLAADFLSQALQAQPTLMKNEFYYIGDEITMINCDTTGVNAGMAGAGITWDFSGLQPTGGTYVTIIAQDTSTVFLTSDLMVKTTDGKLSYVQENNTDSYLNGVYDSATNITEFFYRYDQSKRPVSYTTVYVDTYQVAIPANSTAGKGYRVQEADGYGTLILPTGTYNNVLRIREVQSEIDTLTSGVVSVSAASYLWFDSIHRAPLLRLDSVTGPVTQSYTVRYFGSMAGISDIQDQANRRYTAGIINNELLLTGDFEQDEIYQVTVLNIIGTRIFTTEFTAYHDPIHFDMARDVYPGIYIVSISLKNDPSARQLIKVIRQ